MSFKLLQLQFMITVTKILMNIAVNNMSHDAFLDCYQSSRKFDALVYKEIDAITKEVKYEPTHP